MPLTTTQPVPLPLQDPIGVPLPRQVGGKPDKWAGLRVYLPDSWVRFFTNQTQVINQASQTLASVTLTGQTASVGSTQFNTGSLSTGMYQVQAFSTVTQAATTSSSLTVTLQYTYNAQTKTYAFPAMTGNTTGTTMGQVHCFLVDAASPILYSTTYASVGATSMTYAFALVFGSV